MRVQGRGRCLLPLLLPFVLLLPGSRGQELEANLASLLASAEIVKERLPKTRLVVATLHERHGDIAEGVATLGRVLRAHLDGHREAAP